MSNCVTMPAHSGDYPRTPIDGCAGERSPGPGEYPIKVVWGEAVHVETPWSPSRGSRMVASSRQQVPRGARGESRTRGSKRRLAGWPYERGARSAS